MANTRSASATLAPCLLRTSLTQWDNERIVGLYWTLSEVEATFRSLKSELGLREIYHRTRKRVQGHLLISVLAYQAVHMLAHDVASSGRNDELAEDPLHVGEHTSDHDSDGRVEWTSSGGTSEYAAECRAAPAAQEDGDGNRFGSNADKWGDIGIGATEVVT